MSGTVRLRRIHAVDRSDNTTDIEEFDQYSCEQEEEQEDCIVEPDRLSLQCIIGVNNVQPGSSQLRITNNLTHRTRAFSLFSARGKLKFLHRQGIVPAGGHMDIIVRSRRSAATSKLHHHQKSSTTKKQTSSNNIHYNFETILILIDGKYSQQLDVDMEIIDERQKRTKEEEEDSLLLSQSVVSDIQATPPPVAPHHRHHPSIGDPIRQDEEQILTPPQNPVPIPTTIATIQPIKSKCPICVMEQECC